MIKNNMINLYHINNNSLYKYFCKLVVEPIIRRMIRILKKR